MGVACLFLIVGMLTCGLLGPDLRGLRVFGCGFEFVASLDLAWVGLGFVDVACMSRVDLYLGLKGFSVSFPHRYSYLLLSFSDLKSILKKWLYFVFSFVWLSWL